MISISGRTIQTAGVRAGANAQGTSNEQARRPRRRRTQQQRQTRQASCTMRPRMQQRTRKYSQRAECPRLERPEVLYSNNHLLVVNKPAGWKSQPGNGSGMSQYGDVDPKCLLTYLKSKSLGGGSQCDFLIPTHRLDQPCTGVLIFAKNGKAASRVQVAWSKKKVKKEYWVVVEGGNIGRGERGSKNIDGLELLRCRSRQSKSNVYQLSAILKSASDKGGNAGHSRRSGSNAGGSVTVEPIPPNLSLSEFTDGKDGRVCHVEWRHLLSLPALSPSSRTRHLLSVSTDTGAKHQVRALLALAGGTPISGDLRYGNSANSQHFNQGRANRPLPDGSVALHARLVSLPTVSLGGMDFLKDEPFIGSIPNSWQDFFGISEDDVRGLI